MVNDFMVWVGEIIASFDGSDLFAFVGGCLAMVVYKNVRAMMVNRDKTDKRHISLPKLNAKYLLWIVVLIGVLGVMWSTYDTGNAIRQNVHDTQRLAIAVCENAKVSGVERKALQDLLITSMNAPEQKLPQDDPVRKEWGKKIALQYLGSLEDAAKQRSRIQKGEGLDPNFWERYFGPDTPEPDCYQTFR